MQCCGVNYFEDWQDTAWWNLPSRRNNKVRIELIKVKSVTAFELFVSSKIFTSY